jgi:uncharacterized protein (TIGR02271 family)
LISTDDLSSLMDANVLGADDDKLGGVGQVYLDDATGQPAWVTVKTGFFGTNENFVPLADASQQGDSIRVPYRKDKDKGAPNMAPDGSLSRDEEAELYAYYGVGGYDTDTTYTDTVDTTTTGTTDTFVDTDRTVDTDTTVGYDTSGPTTDEAMTRSEERLDVGVQRTEAGRARLRKYVVTEQQNVTVPVQREEVRLEREPITDTNVDNALEGPAISEEEHEVVLHTERPVVTTEAVPVERVRLETDTVVEEQTVTGDVRKEQIELEQDGTTTTYGTTNTSDTDRV